MTRPAPNFGALLAPAILEVPEPARPALLARLERGAAERYRGWADQAGAAGEGLRACAAREDEIATRIERLLPADAPGHAAIERVAPGARALYYGVFDGLSLREQLEIQADAERQGAAAWRGMAEQSSDAAVCRELEACARLEETSADHLDALLADPEALPA